MLRHYTILLAFVLLSARAHGQILYGGLVGHVTDKSDAVIPVVPITVTNQESGAVRTLKTNEAGIYGFPTLTPGTYTVSVRLRGFRPYSRTGIDISAQATIRVDIKLDVGDVTEQVTVEAGVAGLQTETAEVRRTMTQDILENATVPLSRNYQSLLELMPGVSPPQDAGSFAANPSGSLQFSVNGVSNQTNNIRLDGASSYNTNQPQYTAINPTMESIQVVEVVTGSMDAEQGLAGGAAIHLQTKSGTNKAHGSAFWYHNNQHLDAYPYFSDRTQVKPKFISNHPGGTIGGPIKKNRLFYFVSYERSADNSNAQAFFTVPTDAMRRGDMSASTVSIYDPLTGAQWDPAKASTFAGDRTAFPNKQIPASRISPVAQRILTLPDWARQNRPGTGALGITSDYLASSPYWTRRDQGDSKVNFNITDKWTAFARLSILKFDQLNPAVFGSLAGASLNSGNTRPGMGNGTTYSGTFSTTYVATSTMVFDGYVASTLQEVNAGPDNLNVPFARDVLKIPGTNGPESFNGGMVQMTIEGGFTNLGYQQNSPYFVNDYMTQYAANGSWSHGKHSVRFGFETLRFNLNQQVANPAGATGGPAGSFNFRQATTSLRGGPATNAYNGISSFLLGIARDAGRSVLTIPVLQTRTRNYALFVSDRWQIKPTLTLSYGLRWEYYPYPTRPDRGMERYDFNTNQMLVCGVGSVPRDCGLPQSKRLFAPRVGIAWRGPMKTVVRTGYGLSYDPYNVGRDLRGNYPAQYAQNLIGPDTRAWITTLEQGLPSLPPPIEGDKLAMPLDAALLTADPSWHRGYVQSWNFTLERQFGTWIATAGYVGTRSVRHESFLDANYGLPGGGQASSVLVQKFKRTANTQILGTIGTPKYDGLQTRLSRRFRGYTVTAAYTYANTRSYASESSSSTPRIGLPSAGRLNYGPAPNDLRHVLAFTTAAQAPFGKGRRWASSGVAAQVLGGWQANLSMRMQTGFPVTAAAPSTVLNAPGSSNFADCLGPITTTGDPHGWWLKTNLANPNTVSPNTPRFGTCGAGVLRGPGLINADAGVTRTFRLHERFTLQFRTDAMNLSNTPHFANPTGDISNANFGVVTAVQNRGRAGIDQRIVRFGLRLGF